MRIKFFQFEKELVRDNHGCPCRTDYRMKFTVGKILFTAESTDFLNYIEIYRGGNLVMEIPVHKEKPHNPQMWHRSIEQAFADGNSLLGDTCEKVANDIAENLMTAPDLAWI